MQTCNSQERGAGVTHGVASHCGVRSWHLPKTLLRFPIAGLLRFLHAISRGLGEVKSAVTEASTEGVSKVTGKQLDGPSPSSVTLDVNEDRLRSPFVQVLLSYGRSRVVLSEPYSP